MRSPKTPANAALCLSRMFGHTPAMQTERTQVGILGGGPAGLLLSHLLARAGIDSVVLESRSRARLETQVRAGVLEQGTRDLLVQSGVGARMQAQGLRHEGCLLRFGGETRRIDFAKLTGKAVMVYGQHEVVRDLIAARLDAGGDLRFEAEATRLDDLRHRPTIYFTQHGVERRLDCAVVAGCDGFHGIARQAVTGLQTFERAYPFGWLGILAEMPPASDELVYANHEDGFALLSMRSPSVSRMYLQCAPDEDPAAWSADRVWQALSTRLGLDLPGAPILQQGVTAMRSFVAEPMRQGRLLLAGDAAHIVPPTGAKGMNLAVGDIAVLSRALERWFATGDEAALEGYSERCLRRIWAVQRFSWWMTSMLHRFPEASAFERRVQMAELDYVTGSEAAAATLAENYVGLPF